jgi:hypothetical protein
LAEKNLVGRCGLYCGACTTYRAYKDDGDFQKLVATYFKCPPEKVRCEGCQALTPDCWGKDCKIVQCTRAKGFSFCYECTQFEDKSCEKYSELAQRYLEDNVDARANLAKTKSGQVAELIAESKERFKCPNCRKPLPEGYKNATTAAKNSSRCFRHSDHSYVDSC